MKEQRRDRARGKDRVPVKPHAPERKPITHRTQEGWFAGFSDPVLGHRTRKAALATVPRRLRGQVRPRLVRFKLPLFLL